ncbi:MAG: prealbumin-like fold domain-containing protein, partial [Oscillospiraceae bacterium]|nr:prealbumin-like fold domain-containing protein [Oscillospiraceae bacterium]
MKRVLSFSLVLVIVLTISGSALSGLAADSVELYQTNELPIEYLRYRTATDTDLNQKGIATIGGASVATGNYIFWHFVDADKLNGSASITFRKQDGGAETVGVSAYASSQHFGVVTPLGWVLQGASYTASGSAASKKFYLSHTEGSGLVVSFTAKYADSKGVQYPADSSSNKYTFELISLSSNAVIGEYSTDKNGKVAVTGLAVGEYEFRALNSSDRYISASLKFSVSYASGVWSVVWDATKTSNAPVVVSLPGTKPAATPTPTPTAKPTPIPTAKPTPRPTAKPTATPSAAPTATPSAAPTATPSAAPTATPSAAPTATPSAAPTATPSAAPTATPSAAPTATPAPFLSTVTMSYAPMNAATSSESVSFIRYIVDRTTWKERISRANDVKYDLYNASGAAIAVLASDAYGRVSLPSLPTGEYSIVERNYNPHLATVLLDGGNNGAGISFGGTIYITIKADGTA